jgi:hypothetical protein
MSLLFGPPWILCKKRYLKKKHKLILQYCLFNNIYSFVQSLLNRDIKTKCNVYNIFLLKIGKTILYAVPNTAYLGLWLCRITEFHLKIAISSPPWHPGQGQVCTISGWLSLLRKYEAKICHFYKTQQNSRDSPQNLLNTFLE